MSSLLDHAIQADLSLAQLEELQREYRVWPFINFTIWWRGNAPTKKANALGIQNDTRSNSTYELACRAFNLRHCRDFQSELGINSPSSRDSKVVRHGINNQMVTLAEMSERVVFFVPPKLVTHEQSMRTKFEMQYLLKPIIPIEADIVFGAYSFMSHALLLAAAKSPLPD